MPALNVAYLEMRLSGGTGNTNPDASLGGDISSERVLSQSTTALTNVTGVTIEYAGGNPEGAGTLAYTNTGQTLKWTPFGETVGVAVAVGAGGKFAILGATGSTGFILVDVVPGSLPGSDQSDSVTVANIANETFDNVSKAESFSGDTEYRCIYVKNTNDGSTRSVSSLTRSGATATAVSTAHGYHTGQLVTIEGANETEYNGEFTITVTDANTFTYDVPGTPATPATGTVTCRNTDPFLDLVAFISTQPSPGTIAIGKDPAGVGDGIDRSVTSINRSGSTATVVTAAPHGYKTGQSIRIAGADQTEYNGTFTITVTNSTTFTYTVSGTPVTPATGSIVCSRGRAVVVANESTAPAGVTFTSPVTESSGISLGLLLPGESAALWIRRVIAVKNTVSNAASISLLSIQAYF